MTGKYINRRETRTRRKCRGISDGNRSDGPPSDRRLLASIIKK